MLKKKPKKKKLKITKVQTAFNRLIRERDGRCVTADGSCAGRLECSHFYPVGGNGSLRFHPKNAHGQCTKHHMDYHNRDSRTYNLWMENNVECLKMLDWLRTRTIKYSQPVLRDIYRFCTEGNLKELEEYINTMGGVDEGDWE